MDNIQLETARLILRPMLPSDFDVLNLPQLISLVRAGNLASKGVAEKVSLTLVEEFTRYEIPYWKFSLRNKNA